MSGTSTDGIDIAALDISGASCAPLGFLSFEFPPELRASLLDAQIVSESSAMGTDPLLWIQQLALALSQAYAEAVHAAMRQFNLPADSILAVGAHGQTIRHRPDLGVTWQLLNPAAVAEMTGLTVVSDFRSRDVAAGGQGAPLVPAFHAHWLHTLGHQQAVVANVGGFSNITVLDGDALTGTDCGPGNVLMDAWIQHCLQRPYDEAGRWAASGQTSDSLLAMLLAHPFFMRTLPTSTGRDEFHLSWLQGVLTQHASSHGALRPADVQSTLLDFTVQALARGVESLSKSGCPLVVCGGGAQNSTLLQRLQNALPDYALTNSDALGLPTQAVEATAFAWLAGQTMRHLPGNHPSVTGARGFRVLGSITPSLP